MMPPLITVGSIPAPSSMAATREVVVVLPWVPAQAMDHFSRISSPSISERWTTGSMRSRAARSSGLSGLMAVEITRIEASSMFEACWPTKTLMPSFFRRLTFGFSDRSLPCTE